MKKIVYNQLVKRLVKSNPEDHRVADILDLFFKKFKRDDFVFTKLYKVKNHFKKTRGKWSSAISNSVFLDSKKFHMIYSSMLFKRVRQVMKRSLHDGDLNMDQYSGIELVTDMIQEQVNASDISEYALRAIVKGEDSHQ